MPPRTPPIALAFGATIVHDNVTKQIVHDGPRPGRRAGAAAAGRGRAGAQGRRRGAWRPARRRDGAGRRRGGAGAGAARRRDGAGRRERVRERVRERESDGPELTAKCCKVRRVPDAGHTANLGGRRVPWTWAHSEDTISNDSFTKIEITRNISDLPCA